MTRYDDETLEAAAQLLERTAGNNLYEAAWRAGAKRIRALKSLKSGEGSEILNEVSEQISTSSGFTGR